MAINIKVALGSPFPWSPGHLSSELDYLIMMAQDNPNNIYYLPIPPISCWTAIYRYYRNELEEKYNIILIEDFNLISKLMNSKKIEKIDIALSHVKCLPTSNCRIRSRKVDSFWGNLFHLSSFEQYAVSHFDFRNTQYKFCKLWYENRENFNVPLSKIKLSNELINSIGINPNKPIVLINIRERSLNASFDHDLELFRPAIVFLIEKGYELVDVSHDQKSCEDELRKMGVKIYSGTSICSFENDIQLFSNAVAYIGGGGITHLAALYRLPVIWPSTILINRVPFKIGYTLPCRIKKRIDHHILNFEEHIEFDIMLKENWDFKFDAWTKKYTNDSNLLNMTDEVKKEFEIIPPNSTQLLYTTIDLLERVERNIYSTYTELKFLEPYSTCAIIPELSPYY